MLKKFLPPMSALFVMTAAIPALAENVERAGGDEGHDLLYVNLPTILWVLVLFLILVTILYKTAWKNVLAGLKAREERIRKDIADAEETRVKAEASLRDYTARLTAAEAQVRDILSKGAIEADKIATSIKMSAQKEAEEAKVRATQEIESAKDHALSEIYEKSADLATSIAEKIIRRSLNADDQRDLVKQSLEQLQNVSQN